MTVISSQVTVGTTATLLASGGPEDSSATRDFSVLIKRPSGTTDVYIGGFGVTTANGFVWAGSESPMEVVLEPGEELYGVVASGSQVVHVLRSGR